MEEDEETQHQDAATLFPLPDEVEHLNSITKKALIRGLMKDLKV